MKGFPKTIGSGQDLFNCLALVQAGELTASDLRQSITALHERRYLHCPILEVSANRKTVTIGYCAEAVKGECGTGTISKVEHVKGEVDENAGGMDSDTPTSTVITLAAALPEGEIMMRIPVPVDPVAALGITEEQIQGIMEVLKRYE